MSSVNIVFKLLYDFCRHSTDERIVRNIASYDSPRSNNAIVAYMHSWQNGGIASYPNIIANEDRLY